MDAEDERGSSDAERPASESVNERMAALGRRSGEARRKRKEQQGKKQRKQADYELDANGIPVDIEGWSMAGLVEVGGSETVNAAARIAALKEARARPRTDPTGWGSHAEVKQGREKFHRRIEALAARHAAGLAQAGRCPTCERALSPSEAASLMVKGANESVAGWAARVTAPPSDERVQRLGEEAKAKERLGQEEASAPVPAQSPVAPASPPFQDPAFVQALEERRELGLGPVVWDEDDAA